MSINVNDAVSAIKKAGVVNTRVTQMPNQSLDGLHQIEVQTTPGVWQPILMGIKKTMAEDIIRQATNRVILG